MYITNSVMIRGRSSVGRAHDWQSWGQEFEPLRLHQNTVACNRVFFLLLHMNKYLTEYNLFGKIQLNSIKLF